VAEIDFADGFDVPEPLAWGLTPAQLGAAVTGAVAAYLVIRSPIPRVVAVPLAVVAAATGLTLALVQRDGRTLISWLNVAARFWARPRQRLMVLTCVPERRGPERGAPCLSQGADGGDRPVPAESRDPWANGSTQVETARRIPLVLLPEPVEPPPVPAPGVALSSTRAALRDLGAAGAAPLLAFRVPAVPDVRRGSAHAPLVVAPVEPEVHRGSGCQTGRGPGLGEGDGAPSLRATRRLSFYSLSGGTGRTTLAVEVAGLLACRAHAESGGEMLAPPRVALVDLDLLSPRAGIRLGIPAAIGWDLTTAEGDAQTAVDGLFVAHPSGLLVLPGPARVLPAGTGERPDVVRGVAAAVNELERRGCDTVVLDVAGDLSALTRWALESAHDIFVTLTPTAGGVHDAYRATEALRRLGLRHRIRYVVNRSRGQPAFAEAMLDLDGCVVAEIPDDPELERAEETHRLVARESSGPTAAALRALAATVDARFMATRRPAARSATGRIRRRRAV